MDTEKRCSSDGEHKTRADVFAEIEKDFTDGLSAIVRRRVPVTIEWVEFSTIDHLDPPYHKSISARVVEGAKEKWIPQVAGFLAVNIRPDGTKALNDGRHRRDIMIAHGKTGAWCIVTRGATVQEEAMFFKYYQSRKNMSRLESFRASDIEGDPVARRIKQCIHAAGCRLPYEKGASKGRTTVSALKVLMEIYLDEECGGTTVLISVLRTCRESFPEDSDGLKSVILAGVHLIMKYSDGPVDTKGLVAALSTRVPNSLVQVARERAARTHEPHKCALAQTVLDDYNRKAKRKEKRNLRGEMRARSEGTRDGNRRAQHARAVVSAGAFVPYAVPDKFAGYASRRRATRDKHGPRGAVRDVPPDGFAAHLKEMSERGVSNDRLAEAFSLHKRTIQKFIVAAREGRSSYRQKIWEKQ